MASSAFAAKRTVLLVALACQLLVLLGALFGYWQSTRYVEFSLQRSVEHAAAQALAQWSVQLRLLSEPLAGQEADRAHLLPIPTLADAQLQAPEKLPPGPARALPGADALWVGWPAGLSGGLSGVASVRALPSCRRCHPSFQPGQVVGSLRFRVPTPFLSKLLAARRLNLLALVSAVTLAASAALWTVTSLALRRRRRLQAEAEAARQALEASEARYRLLVEHSLVGVYLIQEDRFLYCNPRMAEMFGYTPEEVVREKRVGELVAPEDRLLVAENLRKRFAGEVQAVRYRFTAVKKDGTRFPVEVFGARTLLPSGPAVLGMIVDNSAVQWAQQLLETAYRAAVALPGEAIFPQAAQALAALLQMPAVFVSRVEGDTLAVLGSYGTLLHAQLPLLGTPCQQVVAGKRPVEISQGTQVSYQGPPFVPFDPQSYFGYPLLDRQGQVLGVLAAVDVRPRQLEEVERRVLEIYAVRLARELEEQALLQQQRELEQRLAASEKLAALGELASGVAHDFNNVLAGILAEAEVLARQLPASQQEQAQRIVQLAQRGGEVVRRILAFARPQTPAEQLVSVERLVAEAVTLAQRSFGPKLAILTQVEPGLFVGGDAGNLQQVLLNLLTNARDAMPEGGSVRVRARRHEQHVLLQVEDEGVGIPPEMLPRVFEPFFTTKPRGQGTGLGLTTAFRTVEAHGGRLEIASTPGQGTCVSVLLPAAAPPIAGVDVPTPPRVGIQARVLLVDDEPAILAALSNLLEQEGFQVAAFPTAEEAWAWAQRAQLEAAVLDVLLPGMSGVELALKLLSLHPQLALVFSSGHGVAQLPPELASHPKLAFQQKPYAVAALAQTLHQLLARP